MKYAFAIIEDEETDYETLKGILIRYAAQCNDTLEVFRFSSFESFLFQQKERKYDLIFMDIMMNGINGLDGARKLRENGDDTALVFVTTMSRMAAMGYEVDALDFIIKPIEYPSFSLKMNRIMRKIKKENDRKITIKKKDGFLTIDEKDIIYVEVRNHLLVYHTVNGYHSTYGSMKNAVSQLSKSNFFKCNSCYLVNMSYVTGIKGYSLFVRGEELLISHPQKPKFLKAYQTYIQGE